MSVDNRPVTKINEVIELKRKQKEIEQAKIEREYGKLEEGKRITEVLAGLDFDTLEANLAHPDAIRSIVGELEMARHLMRNSVPFISDTLGKIVPQIAGQITMVGAISGTGKSTTTAAIAHRNYTAGKKTLIISNEESTPKILSRIACIEEDISFNDYFTDLVSTADRKRVAKRIDDIKNFVTPVDHPLASTCVERVVDYLSKASKKGYSLAIVDFLQRIVRSETNPTAERVHTLMTFKDLLTDYSGSHSMPVVVMAQLKPMEPDEQDRNIQTRIGWSTGFYECCANVIEAIKIDNIPVTTYHIQKGRFSGAKKLWSPHEFKNGSFVPISKSRVTELRAKEKDKQVQDSLEELLGDKKED